MRTRTAITPVTLAMVAVSLAAPGVAYADVPAGPALAVGIGIELVFGVVLVAICVAIGIVLLRFLRKREAARTQRHDDAMAIPAEPSSPAEMPAPAGAPAAQSPADSGAPGEPQ